MVVEAVPHTEETQIPIITPIPVITAAAEDMIVAIVMVDDIEVVVVDIVAGKVTSNLLNREAAPVDTKDTVIRIVIRPNGRMTFINVNFISHQGTALLIGNDRDTLRAQDVALNMAAIQQVITAAIVTVTIVVHIVVHRTNHLRAVLSAQPHFVHVKYPLSVQENEWHHQKVCHLDDKEVQPHIVDEVAFCVVYDVLNRRRRRQLFCEKNICR